MIFEVSRFLEEINLNILLINRYNFDRASALSFVLTRHTLLFLDDVETLDLLAVFILILMLSLELAQVSLSKSSQVNCIYFGC